MQTGASLRSPDEPGSILTTTWARFNSETLEVTVRGKTIDDVLNMSIEEGVTFFAGLHLADVERLLTSLNRLVDAGHTVVLIEHHMDVIKTADHVIDLGPEGGHAGGRVVVTGTPEDVVRCKASHTGRFLKVHLRR